MEDAKLRVNAPATMLIVVGAICLVLDLLDAGMTVLGFLSPLAVVGLTALQVSTADNASFVRDQLASSGISIAISVVMGCIHAVCAILGLIASVVTIQGGRRLMALTARNTVIAGAVLGVAQPVLWLFTGCFTSSCGGLYTVCMSPVWLLVSIAGVVAAVTAFNALNDPDVAPHFTDLPVD